MPTRMQDLSNTDLSALSASSNKTVMRYNASTGKFDVVQIDNTLGLAKTLPKAFVDAVQREIKTENLSLNNLDGGTF